MPTEITTDGGMHIDSDPKTGAIAAPVVNEETIKAAEQNAEVNKDKEEFVDPRKAIMDKIYGARQDQFKKELEYAAAISNGATFESAADDVEETPIVQEEPKEEQEKENAPAALKEEPKLEDKKPAEVQKHRVQINGQVYDLTDQEIAIIAQRSAALGQQQNYYPQYQQQVSHQEREQEQKELTKEELKEIARKITYGSEDESANALGELVGLTARLAAPKQQYTPDQIADAATQRALQQMRFESDLKTISSEYADIYESRAKTLVAADKVGFLRAKYAELGVQKPDLEIWREACKDARSEFGSPQNSETAGADNKDQKSVQPVASISQSRIERKRAAPQTISAVNKTQAMAESNKAPSGSDIVAAMRASRGQAAM